MKLGDLLNKMAAKIGMQNDQTLVDLLSNADLATRDVADEFASALDNGLMSFEGAKNNPAVLNHFKPIVLKAVDDKMAIIAETLGIADEISGEKSTYKKMDALNAAFEARLKQSSKRNANDDEIERLQITNRELTAKLAALSEQGEKDIAALKERHSAQVLDMLINGNLRGRNYANKQLSPEINELTARTLLNAELQKSGAIVVNDGGVLKLKQAENPSMDYVDSGYKTVSFADFTDKVLADAKLLEVSNGGAQPQHQVIVPSNNGTHNTRFTEAMESARANIASSN